MSAKIRLTGETKNLKSFKVKLYRIECVERIVTPNITVEPGQRGGWVQGLHNIADNGWVGGEAKVFGQALVKDNALITDNASMWDNAELSGNANMLEQASLSDNARVYDNAQLSGWSNVSGFAEVYDNARVAGFSKITDETEISGNAFVTDDTYLSSTTTLSGNAHLSNEFDYIHVITHTSRPLPLTLFREKNGGHGINMGCWSGTVDELEHLFRQDTWIETVGADCERLRPEMLALCTMLRARIASWGTP